MKRVEVPERGSTRVAPSIWRELAASEAFWDLVAKNVIKIAQNRDGSATLSGGKLVGLAICDGVIVSVVEKVSGALRSLLESQRQLVRVVDAPGAVTDSQEFLELVASAFVQSVHSYVSTGRDWQYRRVQRRGSVAGGRLLTAETLKLRASGMVQKVVYDKREISHVTPTNQVLAATIRVLERLYTTHLISAATIAASRAIAPFFADNDTAEVLYSPSTLHSRDAFVLSDRYESPVSEMLQLAAVILSGSGMGSAPSVRGTVPFSWFLDLELAFEVAVRSSMSRLALASETVGKGNGSFFFPDSGRARMRPDIVLSFDDFRTPLVGDVKYKTFRGLPESADMYQVLTHASGNGARDAFLVYPANRYRHETYGQSVTGIHFGIFELDVRNIVESVRLMKRDLLVGSGS